MARAPRHRAPRSIARASPFARRGGIAARSCRLSRRNLSSSRCGEPCALTTGVAHSDRSRATSPTRRRASSSRRRSGRDLVAAIRREFPTATGRPPRAPTASFAGEYDLLGYRRRSRFDRLAARPRSPARERRGRSGRPCRFPRSALRRSQDHLGAESPSALARARRAFWLTGDRRYRDRVRRGARELARREPAAHRHQLGEHAGARVPLDLLALGAALLRRSTDDRRRREPVARRPARRPRSAADARRAQPLALLQPEHAPARRGAGAVRRPAARCRSCARSRPLGGDRPPHPARRDRSRRSAPTAATASGRRTTTATRSTSTCSRSSSRASPATRPPREFERRGRPARRCAARLLADDRGRVPHIGDDDGGTLTPLDGSRPPTICATASRSPRALRRTARTSRSAPRRKKRCGCWRIRRCAATIGHAAGSHAPSRRRRPRCPTPATTSRARRSGDHLVDRRRPARLSERRPRARRRAVADADGRAACRCSSIRGTALLHDRPGAARSHALVRAAQHARRRRPIAVDSAADRSTGRTSPTAHVHRWRTHDGFDYFDGAHDGYRPLEHRRHVLALHGDLRRRRRSSSTATGSTRRRVALAPRSALDGRPSRASRRGAHAAAAIASSLAVPHGVVERFDGDADTGLGLALAGLRPRRADDDAPRRHTRRRAVLDGQRVRPRSRRTPVVDVDCVPVWAEAGALAHVARRSASTRAVVRPTSRSSSRSRPTAGRADVARRRLRNRRARAVLPRRRPTRDAPRARRRVARATSSRAFQLACRTLPTASRSPRRAEIAGRSSARLDRRPGTPVVERDARQHLNRLRLRRDVMSHVRHCRFRRVVQLPRPRSARREPRARPRDVRRDPPSRTGR